MYYNNVKAITKEVFVKNYGNAAKRPKTWKSPLLFTLLLTLLSALATAADQGDGDAAEPIASYIGPAACQACHQDKYEGFVQTAHHLTSRLPDSHTIAGDFSPDKAAMWTRNPNLWFEMSAGDDGFYQTANIWEDNRLKQHSERIDIVTGSGKIGQTYLYWRGDRLYQLPVSYWAASDKWINSPGYLDGQAVFDRPVGPRCLECHTTYFTAESYERNIYGQDGFMLGISCERCHGPGAEHAAYQRRHPGGKETPHILHPGDLTRQRSIEVCAQCHSGPGIKRGLPFTYRPGEPLGQYIEPEPYDVQNSIGVHSNNQVARLSLSTCFKESDDMTCVSCHNPHAPERGDRQLFSQRCLECHNSESCGMAPELGAAIEANCIDCHMPQRGDKTTRVQGTKGIELPMMPDHLIGVYPDATRLFISGRNQSGQ